MTLVGVFAWPIIAFPFRLSALERRARNLSDEDAQKIIESSRIFSDSHSAEGGRFDFRLENDVLVDVPHVISRLNPRRLYGGKNELVISLIFMMDSGGELYAFEDTDGLWKLDGRFGEREPRFRIYPKEK